ncbi:hypothetical protein [Adhaeribacter arboris]|uniref:hypothetical protein n=1 Tax=Adhaeribacter arboris TaxID=2072846 RepID=UPI0011B1C964|nr:hypothetical protein [Adhaeribacter arboris]
MKNFLFTGFFSLLALTSVLFGGTFWLTGCFYETNDDIILTLLISGFSGGEPISDLTLYLHGISVLISKLYQNLPGVPWYGFSLYSLLFIITILAFRFMYQVLKPMVEPRVIYGIILLFYLANWYEHVFWFNYSRLAILLAGVASLNAWLDLRLHHSGIKKRLLAYGSLFFLALCLRPSFAVFGIGLTLPFLLLNKQFYRVSFKRTAYLLLPFLLAGVFFSAWLKIKSTPAQTNYRHLDVQKSQILDYNWCCPLPSKPNEKLLYTGLSNWFLADKNIQNFLQQQRPDGKYFQKEVLVFKFQQFLPELIRSQFLIIILLAAHIVWLIRSKATNNLFRLFSYHFYFWSLLFATGILLKTPPRVLTPAISLLLLMHLTFPLPFSKSIKWPLLFKFCGLLLLVLPIYRINHRANWQQQRQKQSEAVIAAIQNNFPHYVIVTAGLENELRALSPFKNYFARKNRLLFLTGWQTLDPHYPGYLQSLAGKTNLAGALEILSRREKVVWVSNPQMTIFLVRYFNYFYQTTFKFTLIKPVKGASLPNNLNFYQVEKVI